MRGRQHLGELVMGLADIAGSAAVVAWDRYDAVEETAGVLSPPGGCTRSPAPRTCGRIDDLRSPIRRWAAPSGNFGWLHGILVIPGHPVPSSDPRPVRFTTIEEVVGALACLWRQAKKPGRIGCIPSDPS